MDKKNLRKGFTTGTASAAAAISALLQLLPQGYVLENIPVILPDGTIFNIPVTVKHGITGICKDSGDDPDVTDGIFIYADVELTESGKVYVYGGEGVGRVTKPGLSVNVGEAAINPVPLKMIADNIRRFLPEGAGAKVTIHIPEGAKVAEKTFNSRLGIAGGISILGTTGIVEPMSSDALIKSIRCEIEVKFAGGAEFLWLVPGKIGERALLKMLPDAAPVQMSNFAGEALRAVTVKGYSSIGLAGHPSKLAKLVMGHENTHSKCSPQANNYVKHILGITKSINTVEEMCLPEYAEGFSLLAEKISQAVRDGYKFKNVKVLLFSMKGELLGSYE